MGSLRFVRSLIARVLRQGIYPARHPLIKGLLCREWRWFLFPEPSDMEGEFLSNLNLKGLTVYDVGANLGLMTLFFARKVGREGHVVSFEPHPKAFEPLRRNVQVNAFKNVTLINKAVGCETTTMELIVPSGSLLVSTFVTDHAESWLRRTGDTLVERALVPVDTIDNVVASGSLPVPDLIKIDVEGYELQVLGGSVKTIEAHRPAFFIELHGHTVSDGKSLVTNVVQFLLNYSYNIYHVEYQKDVEAGEVDFVKGHLYCTM